MVRHSCLVVFLFVSLACIGCEKTPENKNGDNEKGNVVNETDLPSLQGAPDCEEPGFELEFEDWMQQGDGLVIGEVEKIEPALDIGRTVLPVEGGSEEERIRNADECKEIRNGFRVELTNTSGFFHGEERVPDKFTVYLGSMVERLFPEKAPKIEDGEVTWPNGQALQEGMVVGGLVYHNNLVDRWSFRPGMEQPLFEITEEGLAFQDVNRSICGAWPPEGSISGMTRSEIETEIEIIREVIGDTPKEDRRWSAKRIPTGEAKWIVDWVGTCITEEYLEVRKEEQDIDCKQDIDCSYGQICMKGECIDES